MKVLDLFSGIGGFSLGLERAGMETVAFCEIDEFCQKVLRKHWPNVPIYNDVRTLNYEGPVDLICGGYPCQPFSNTGRRLGKEDERHLWPAMCEQIRQHNPDWVICENVRGHVSDGLDDVLMDLENLGYAWWTGIVPACAVGAYHNRERVWIVSNNSGQRMERCIEEKILGIETLPYGQISQPFQENEKRFDTHQSRLCRSLHGLSYGVDRVKAIGNAVVPQIPEIFGNIIMDIEQHANT